jgi:ABC transport system ATP-binding/permease protein
LNNVVTSTIVFEPEGVREYVGGYDDWQRQRGERAAREAAPTRNSKVAAVAATKTRAKAGKSSPESGGGSRRLGFKEQRELDKLPAQIESLEKEITAFHETMAQPDFYKQAGDLIAEQQRLLKTVEARLTASLQRWEELEAQR